MQSLKVSEMKVTWFVLKANVELVAESERNGEGNGIKSRTGTDVCFRSCFHIMARCLNYVEGLVL